MIYEECGNHRGQQSTCSSFFYFPANGLTNPDIFQPKTFCIPHNFSSSGLVVTEELGNKQTHRLAERLGKNSFNTSSYTNESLVVELACCY